MNFIERIQKDEAFRRDQFPTAAERIYMAHAGVSPLPRVAADAMRAFLARAEVDNPESEWAMDIVEQAREDAALLIGAHADEIALLGPTSVGLSLVANGLEWRPGDEVVSYFDDYPANVYPWTRLGSKGVDYVSVQPEFPGVITWDDVARTLTERTKLVALASCHFLSGHRIDIDAIGRKLGEFHSIFPPLLTQMITLGEKSGELGKMVVQIGVYVRKDLKRRTQQMSMLIEPIVTVGMAVAIGAVALAIYLPIFDMFKQVDN